jgi:hypothetical protein
MSCWCPERTGLLAALTLSALAVSAHSAEVYFQPQAEVSVDGDTNRNMVPSGDFVDKKGASEGFSGDAIGLWGIATPLSDTTIRPEVNYSEYPRIDTDDLRTVLDLNSQFRLERGQAGIEGRFDRESTASSELANPQFNVVNPDLPTTPETGRVRFDTTRTLLTVVPTYNYDLTQRLALGVIGTYQVVDFSGSNAASYIPYTYYLGGASLGWKFSPRLTVTFGGFASHEEAHNGSGSVTANGGTVGFDYKWSTKFSSHLELSGERDDTNVVKPTAFSSSSAGFGATYSTSWVGQLSKVQLSVGRTYTPSGAGGTFRADQGQVEYTRDLTQRLAFTAAGRVMNETSVSRVYLDGNYNYVNFEARLKWKLTPTWYVAGGLGYLRAHYQPPVGSADNGSISISVGYLGLGRPY